MGCIGFPNHPVWEITTACNLKCIHCHTSGGEIMGDELTTEQGKQLLEQLAVISDFRMMAFTGGEPLVRNDLFELLQHSKELGFTNTIATNAVLIDNHTARELKTCGVAIAAVSLDGIDAKNHDRIRSQPGSFDAAIKGMKALDQAGILLHINITVMEYNISDLEALMDLVDELNAGILLFYQLVPVGRGQAIRNSALDLDANKRLANFMAGAQKKIKAIVEPVAGPQYWPYLLERAHINKGLGRGFAEKIFHGCSAGRGFVYIKPNGQVWACPFLEVSCGSVKEQPFIDIWQNSALLNDLRKRENRLQGQCGKCSYRRLCGGCRGRAYAMSGNYLAEDPSCFIHDGKEF